MASEGSHQHVKLPWAERHRAGLAKVRRILDILATGGGVWLTDPKPESKGR